MKTNRFIYSLFSVVIIIISASCNNSPEDKANILIKEAMNKTLYHADTYEPVETVIDSAFSPKDAPAFYEIIKNVVEMGLEMDYLDEVAKRAKASMSIFSGPYQTSFGRNQYKESKEEYDESIAKIEKLKNKGRKKFEDMVSMFNAKPKFIGFKARHSYRAKDNDGKNMVGEMIYIMDEQFEKIIYSCGIRVRAYKYLVSL